MKLSEAQRKLLAEIELNNSQGINPGSKPNDQGQREVLQRLGLIHTYGHQGFAYVTRAGQEALK